MAEIDDILAERGTRYGRFDSHARITQRLKEEMVLTPKWPALKTDQKEALEMIAHKIGRILNGDPDYADSWADIAGYAKLVADRLEDDSHPVVQPDFNRRDCAAPCYPPGEPFTPPRSPFIGY